MFIFDSKVLCNTALKDRRDIQGSDIVLRRNGHFYLVVGTDDEVIDMRCLTDGSYDERVVKTDDPVFDVVGNLHNKEYDQLMSDILLNRYSDIRSDAKAVRKELELWKAAERFDVAVGELSVYLIRDLVQTCLVTSSEDVDPIVKSIYVSDASFSFLKDAFIERAVEHLTEVLDGVGNVSKEDYAFACGLLGKERADTAFEWARLNCEFEVVPTQQEDGRYKIDVEYRDNYK